MLKSDRHPARIPRVYLVMDPVPFRIYDEVH
jgi:hypothetical protein